MKRKRGIVILAGVAVCTLLAFWLWPRPKGLYRATMLPSLGGGITAATSINEHGQVTGFAQTGDGAFHFFLWDRETGMQDLGPAIHTNFRINNAGQIAGTTQDTIGNHIAFIWDRAQGMRLLGTLGGRESRAVGLNNRGQVVGWSHTVAGPSHAFVWDEAAGMRDLGTFGGARSEARWISDTGLVLGLADSAAEKFQAFFWDSEKGMRALDAAVPPSAEWFSMNNRGYVLGQDDNQMFLWHREVGVRGLFPRPGSYILPVVNDANQVLFGETPYPKFVPPWVRRHMEPFFECYLWDPLRGKIPLDRCARRKLGEVFHACDLNDQGSIVGALVKERPQRARAVLLEPIPERWERQRVEPRSRNGEGGSQ